MKKTYQKGIWAERFTVIYLQLKGYRILARRWRTPGGEVDIVARKGHTLVVVEVKRKRRLDGEIIVSSHQQRRLERAARYVIKRWRQEPLNIRFDVVVIMPWRLPCHLRAAWTVPDASLKF